MEKIPVNKAAGKIDLQAYFQKIGYAGEPAPTMDTLKALHVLHPEAIAFENLNPLLRIPVALDRQSVQQKLIESDRGGYCFEHNLLFSHMLGALGFRVKWLAARVLWNVPEGSSVARGHMLLLVEVQEKQYIADVGFGALTLTAPLLLEPGIEQQTPHELYRLVNTGTEYLLEARIRDEWKPLYSFGLQECLLPDYEMASWYLSNHPDSHFVSGLIAARAAPGRRYALRNNALAIHHTGKDTQRQLITSVPALKTVLKDIFKVAVPEIPGGTAILKRLIVRP